MLLPSHKFIVESYSGMKTTPDNKHKYIEIVLRKPAPTNEFGEKFMDDDIFQASVWNKSAEELPVFNHGDKVEALLALKGTKELSTTDNRTYFRYQFSIRKISKID